MSAAAGRSLKEGNNRMSARSVMTRATYLLVGVAACLALTPGAHAQEIYPNMTPSWVGSNSYIRAQVGSMSIATDADLGRHDNMRGKIYIENAGGEPLVANDYSRAVTSDSLIREDYVSSDNYAAFIDQFATLAVATGAEDDGGENAGPGDPAGWNYYVFGNHLGDTNDEFEYTVDGVRSFIQRSTYGGEGLRWAQMVTVYRDKVRVRWIVENTNGDVTKVVKLRFRYRPAPLGGQSLFGREQTRVYVEGYGWTDDEQEFWTSSTSAGLPRRWVSYSPEGEMAVGWTNVADERDRNLVTPDGTPVMDSPALLEGISFLSHRYVTGHPIWTETHMGGTKLTDSELVVHYYFKQQSIRPGEAQVFDLWLGDEWSASDMTAPLAATSSAKSAVGLAEDPDTGEWIWDLGTTGVLRVGGSITNRWSSSMRNGSLTIELPRGLALAAGQTADKTVPTLDPGETGEVTWDLVPDTDYVLAGDVTWTVRASAAAAGGVYTKSVVNSMSLPALSHIRTAPVQAPPSGDERPGYQYLMMSVPFDLDDPDPMGGLMYTSLTGTEVTPRIWRYDPQDNAWDSYPNGTAGTLQPGYGYFVRVPVQTNIAVPTDGTARYLNGVVEVNVPLMGRTSGTGSYTGFNQVGNPFTYPLSLGEVKFVSRGVTYSYDQSWAAGWIPGVLWEWDPTANDGRGGYVLQYGRDFTMSPWKAYWLLANTDLEMVMEPPDVRGATPPAGSLVVTPPAAASGKAVDVSTRSCLAKATGANSTQDWMLQITGECAEAADTSNFVGASSAVGSGANAMCIREAPPVGRYLQVAFPHEDWGRDSGIYALDVRPGGTEAEFDMSVATNIGNTEVTLAWPTISHLPRELSFTLEDVATGERVFMRTASRYTFTTEADGGARQFKIRVSARDRGLQITDLGIEGLARGAAIAYALSDDAEVDLVVLNSAGRVVRTLMKAKACAAGRSTATWDGRSDVGTSVPAGEYRVQLEARSDAGGRVTRTAGVSLR